MKYCQYVGTAIIILCLFGCGAKVATVKNDSKQNVIRASKNELGRSFTVRGKTYTPLKIVSNGHFQKGIASWYGPGFHGRKTSSGEIYDMHALTAAHNILPLNTLVRVTNLSNNKDVVVRVNDRGPFVDDRVIDLSFNAAQQLGMVGPGITPVRVSVIGTKDSTKAMILAATDTKPHGNGSPNPFFAQARPRLLALFP
ncbi:MAG: septal ring lytic transglycosylase RlpA family protein [Desulfomonile sp.]|jgi:rare lipoprotein A|nr:septal ring lytic transglycosylase RlpA family protein [Deltaproteobacteria bacterium]